ncbi:MAG: hypothetical protein ACFE98_01390 [Candidatus Hermodarchaeota archaeon]
MREADIMIFNFIQDPESILYENLFFWLTVGKYDTILEGDLEGYHYEEFIIVKDEWKERILYLENIVPIQTQRFLRELGSINARKIFHNSHFKIYFVIYTVVGRLIGLGLRIITRNNFYDLASTPEDRLQKSMYLLTRGLLRSFYHRIDQIECSIPA